MKKIFFAAMALMMAMTVHAIEQKSPNGNIVLNVELNAKGTPEYQVTYKGRPVIKPSTLGIELAEENSLMDQTTSGAIFPLCQLAGASLPKTS